MRMAQAVKEGRQIESVALRFGVGENSVRSACREFDVTCPARVLTAAERGKELFKGRLYDIPQLALEWSIKFRQPEPVTRDSLLTSLVIYAECIEGLEGDLHTNEHRDWLAVRRDWFDNQKEALSEARSQPKWGTWETVDEVGWYWWLSDDHTLKPILTSLGMFEHLEDMGGHWMKIAEPEYESILGETQ